MAGVDSPHFALLHHTCLACHLPHPSGCPCSATYPTTSCLPPLVLLSLCRNSGLEQKAQWLQPQPSSSGSSDPGSGMELKPEQELQQLPCHYAVSPVLPPLHLSPQCSAPWCYPPHIFLPPFSPYTIRSIPSWGQLELEPQQPPALAMLKSKMTFLSPSLLPPPLSCIVCS